jgi:nitronate monooxygenase
MSNQTFKSLLGTAWPIAAMAMNKVSDVQLAVACATAGILPSLSIFNYYTAPNELDLDRVQHALTEFNCMTNNAPLLLSIGVDAIIEDSTFQVLLNCKVKILEVIFDSPAEVTYSVERTAKRDARIDILRSCGVVLFSKALDIDDIENLNVDGIILKGPDGAGRTRNSNTLIDRIKKCKELYPQLHIIAAGGIGTSAQIQECLDAGAIAVGLGTIFAAAIESAISTETKLKMIEATATDIAKLKNGAKQNALIFKELNQDVNNNTRGLMSGITNPVTGHVFAGAGIAHINSIKSVEEIVNILTKSLTV